MRPTTSTTSGPRRLVLRPARRHAFVLPALAGAYWLSILAISGGWALTLEDIAVGLVATVPALIVGAWLLRSTRNEVVVLTAKDVSTSEWNVMLSDVRRLVYAKLATNRLVFAFETKDDQLHSVMLNGIATRDLQAFVNELHRLAPSVELDLRPIRFPWPNRYMRRFYTLHHPRHG